MNTAHLSFEQCEPNHWQFRYIGETKKEMEYFDSGLELIGADMPGKAAQKFRMVLRNFPEHIGALYHLGCAMKAQGKGLDAWAFFELAVALARSKIPREFVWKDAVISWYAGDNRDYMQSCMLLAIELIERGFFERGSGYLEHLLVVWPNDNLGVRHIVPECYLRMGAYDKALAHAKLHADEDSPYILYSAPLAMLKTGRDGEARESMTQAVARRPKVAQELLKKMHVPPRGMISWAESPGGADEAYRYWQRMGPFWLSEPKAIDLLRSVAVERGVKIG